MGMYDNFVPSETVLCHKCGAELGNDDPDIPYRCVLQSKSLECMLRTYKQGEPVQIKTTESNFFISSGWIEAHTVCDKCKSYVQFKLTIENGIWARIEPWDGEQGII